MLFLKSAFVSTRSPPKFDEARSAEDCENHGPWKAIYSSNAKASICLHFADQLGRCKGLQGLPLHQIVLKILEFRVRKVIGKMSHQAAAPSLRQE